MTNLDSILKSKDITFLTNVHLVKTMVFPVVMYGCERWTIKKAEHRRIDAFELWCWRRLLRVPWYDKNHTFCLKVCLKLNIQKTKIMASSPITSWQIGGGTMETVTGFVFWGSKITADGDCSHEIKRCLLLGRKAMTNLDSILKSRDITLLTKAHIVKAWFFHWSCTDVRIGP